MTTVTLDNISKSYHPGHPVLDNLSLTIQAGELLALLGPSGGGKTTTLRLIAGLLAPNQGDIRFDGRSFLSIPAEKRDVGMVFQENALFPFMSVGDNVAFGLKMKGITRASIPDKVAQALESVQLTGFEKLRPDQLSGGQRQRVALARALVVQPKVLLLDEPLSHLESSLRHDLRAIIRNIQREAGITTIFVTHDQSEAIAVADRIALLIDGSLCQVGSPAEFYTQPVNAQVARFFGAENFFWGVKRGDHIHTGIGELEIAHLDWPDGKVLLTIRPEAIEIGANGHNNLIGQVCSLSYRGPLSYLETQVNGASLHLIAPPFHTYKAGDPIHIHIPKDRICLLPDKGEN